jgi:hypothetical protein
VSADITTPIRYHGATETELRQLSQARRFWGLSDQSTLFPHQGQMRLGPDRLELEGWRDIPRSAITRIDVAFTDAYTRLMAGGVRAGNAASFGLFGGLGKPLILTLRDDDPVYLLLAFRWWLGTNQAHNFAPTIQRWLNDQPGRRHPQVPGHGRKWKRFSPDRGQARRRAARGSSLRGPRCARSGCGFSWRLRRTVRALYQSIGANLHVQRSQHPCRSERVSGYVRAVERAPCRLNR